jgi:SAM-dependent methyltransferase
MQVNENQKSDAWDIVGGMFWKLGRKSARPSSAEIMLFLENIPANARCCIIGASTKELIEIAISQQIRVTVMDFSETMLNDLKAEIGENFCTFWHVDILMRIPEVLHKSFDYVLTDRLINRFTRQDVPVFLQNIITLLAHNGQLRMTVKLGYYPMDLLLIEEGRARGTVEKFYDEPSRTIDYSKATDELETRLVPHGDIPREVLLRWYHGRGKESRFVSEDILSMISAASQSGRGFIDFYEALCPDAPNTNMYQATVQ